MTEIFVNYIVQAAVTAVFVIVLDRLFRKN